jgi:hypothetical protein
MFCMKCGDPIDSPVNPCQSCGCPLASNSPPTRPADDHLEWRTRAGWWNRALNLQGLRWQRPS